MLINTLLISYVFAEAPCGILTGNKLIRLGLLSSSDKINISSNEDCIVDLPDFRTNFKAIVTKLYWRVDSVRQFPEPGTSFFLLSTGSCQSDTRYITITAYFRNTRGTANTSDDQFCTMNLIDTLYMTDKLSPVARDISIRADGNDGRIDPGSLKHLFTGAAISDNCTNLSQLQNSLEFNASPPYPAIIPDFYCNESRNTYRIKYRVTDLCGNISKWAWATITFIDTISPRIGAHYAPSELNLDASCSVIIDRSIIIVRPVDNLVTADHLTLSYRVIYPLSLSGPIPTTGITLHAGGLCPPDNVIKVRVCVQDCSGNGDLHTFDNGVSANCNTYSIILKDITVPTLTGTIPPLSLPVDPNLCTAIMPNLSGILSGFDGCSDVSIYQLPPPGSILNNGEPKNMDLARGVARSFECPWSKIPDTKVDCINQNGPFKSYNVDFIAVDCSGNCVMRRFPNLVSLVPGPSTPSLMINNQLLNKSLFAAIGEIEKLKVENFPNPFNDATNIKIISPNSAHSTLSFYDLQGRLIYRKEARLEKGTNLIKVYKSDLGNSGVVVYTIEAVISTEQKATVRGKLHVL